MKPFDFGGQRSKVKVTMDIYGNSLVNTTMTLTFLCIIIKLGRQVNHDECMNPFDFGDHRSKSQ